MAPFIATIYLFRRCHFENRNLKMGKTLRRKKKEHVLLGNEFNKTVFFGMFPLVQIYFSACPPTPSPGNKDVVSIGEETVRARRSYGINLSSTLAIQVRS